MIIKTRKQGNSTMITVPSEFKIQEGTTLEPILQKDGIFYKFINNDEDLDFDVKILDDLVSEGFGGKLLVEEFQKRKKFVPIAMRNIVEETKKEGKILSRKELEKEIGL